MATLALTPTPYAGSPVVTEGLTGIYWCSTRAAITGSTVWNQIGYCKEGTAELTTADPTITDTNIEESDFPIKRNYKAGLTTFKAEIPDLSGDVLASVYNIVADTTNTNAYYLPETIAVQDGMFLIVPKSGVKGIVFTNAEMVASPPKGKTGKSEQLVISITVTALKGGGTGFEKNAIMVIE